MRYKNKDRKTRVSEKEIYIIIRDIKVQTWKMKN